MYYIVEAPDKSWRLLDDRSPREYRENPSRWVCVGVEFVTLAEGDADDMLLIAAGMSEVVSSVTVKVMTLQMFDMLVADRQASVPDNEEVPGG